jgi:hypothetical protein
MMYIHYIMYKIRINCTNPDQLAFNNNPINKKSYKEIHDKLQPNNIDYIDSVIILHKKTKKNNKIFTLKTLEFLCNKEISEYQFEELIQKMIEIGFYSKDNRPIQFIYIDNNLFTTKHNYDFNSCKPTEVEPRKKNKNQSNYSQEYLYKNV